MLTTHRIQQHFECLELERLRAEVKELQTRISSLQLELVECRRDSSTKNHHPVPRHPEE